MLKKKQRLDKELFLKVLSEGKSFFYENFSIKIKKIDQKKPLFGIVTPGSVFKMAVSRNKAKRQIRHIIKKSLNPLMDGYGVIVFAKKGANKLEFSQMSQQLTVIFKKINIIK